MIFQCAVILFLCIFIDIIIDTVHCALYEPLVLVDASNGNGYDLDYKIIYDQSAGLKFTAEAPGRNIYTACPQNQNHISKNGSLKIQDSTIDRMAINPSCQDSRVKSVVYMKKYYSNIGAICFTIFNPQLKTNHDYSGILEGEVPVDLINFKLDENTKKAKVVWYTITNGNLLRSGPNQQDIVKTSQPSLDESSNTSGQIPLVNMIKGNQKVKNIEDIPSPSVNVAEQEDKPSLVDVYLVPKENFILDNWKQATSSHEILTATMSYELIAQWTALERFIQTLARVVDKVNVRTGVFSHPPIPSHTYHLLQMYQQLSDTPFKPRYFWKAISFTYLSYEQRLKQLGILFIMHNNPTDTKTTTEQKLCLEDKVSKIEWEFLKDEQPKSLMYACSLNEKNMRFFGEKINFVEYEDFNLDQNLLIPNGDSTFKEKNILHEMQQMKNIDDIDDIV